MDDPDDGLPVVNAGNDDAPLRYTGDEIRRAIDRIDHPGVAGRAFHAAMLLADDAIAREDGRDLVAHQRLHVTVGFRHKVLMALVDDGQRFQLAEIVKAKRACAAGEANGKLHALRRRHRGPHVIRLQMVCGAEAPRWERKGHRKGRSGCPGLARALAGA